MNKICNKYLLFSFIWIFEITALVVAAYWMFPAFDCDTSDTQASQSESISFADYYKIDLNKANQEQLCLLPGVGEETAKAIIEYRIFVAAFATVKDITNVPGITEETVEEWGDLVYVSPQNSEESLLWNRFL